MVVEQEQTVIEQLVSRGNEAIAQLEHQLTDITQQITDVQTELATIPPAQDKRARDKSKAQAILMKSESTHNQAVAYAKLAQDTVNEQQAIKQTSTAKKELSAARKAMDKLERESAEAETLASVRETELHSLLAHLQSEHKRLEGGLLHTRAAHKQSHLVLGDQKRDAIIASYQNYQKHIDDLRSKLVEAQSNQFDFYENALREMEGWPDQQRDVRNLRPVDDHLARVIDATMRYIDTLMTDMDHISNDVPLPWDLWDVLIIPAQQVRGAYGLLEERQAKLKQVLEAYHEYCAGK